MFCPIDTLKRLIFENWFLQTRTKFGLLAMLTLTSFIIQSCTLNKPSQFESSNGTQESKRANWENVTLTTPPIKLIWLSASGDTSSVNYEASTVLSWKEKKDKLPALFFVLSVQIPNLGDLQLVDEGNLEWTKLTRFQDGSYTLMSSDPRRNQSFTFQLKNKTTGNVERAGLLVEIPSDAPFIIFHSSCIAPAIDWKPVAGGNYLPLYVGLSCVDHKTNAHLPKAYRQDLVTNQTYDVVHMDSKQLVGKITLKDNSESSNFRGPRKAMK